MKHKKLLISLKKTQWMINKIQEMIENDSYCVDIASQINASIWLLKKVNKEILKQHIACCGKEKLMSNNQREVQEFIEELVRVWDVSTRK